MTASHESLNWTVLLPVAAGGLAVWYLLPGTRRRPLATGVLFAVLAFAGVGAFLFRGLGDQVPQTVEAQRPPGQTLAACIEVKRITTSAAFFLSLEFRQTGGLVRDFYVAALDRPLTANMPNFVEFMLDTQAIQKGVIVGQGNWPQVLDGNRLAFMNEFVMRAEFVGL